MLPDEVAGRALESLESRPPIDPQLSDGDPGDIALIASRNGESQRVVLIMSRHEETETASIQLATNILEAATDFDVVVRSTDSDAPFDLLIQSELYGPVFRDQVRERLGDIPEDVRQRLGNALMSDGDSLAELETGLPLGDGADPRREFKKSELGELETLVSECRAWLSGEAAERHVIDPELLLPPGPDTPYEDAVDQYLELTGVIAGIPEEHREIPPELLTLLDEAGLLEELTRWRTDFGLDVRPLLLLRMPETSGPLADAPTDIVEIRSRRTDVVLQRFAGTSGGGIATLDVETTESHWAVGDDTVVIPLAGRRFCRIRPRRRAA